MKKIAAILFPLFIITTPALFLTDAYAYNFEDYEWGTATTFVRSSLSNKGIHPIINTDEKIVYSDTILGERCTVTLIFTPKTKLLASIKIFWETKYTGEDLKKILISKYGEFTQPNVFIEEYYWQGTSEYDRIVLEYGYVGTTLSYFGGKFQQQYEEEFAEIAEEEKNRF